MAIWPWTAAGRIRCTPRRSRTALRLLLRRRGMLTSNVGEAAAFVRTGRELPAPDLELIFAPVLYVDEGLNPPPAHGFSIAAVCLQPRSRGSVTLRSADRSSPGHRPRLSLGPRRRPGAGGGRRSGRRRIAAAPLGDGSRSERAPGEDGGDGRRELDPRERAHDLPPGRDLRAWGAVVDDELRVNGVDGLRVADASVIPNLMRGHTHAAMSMLALRAAELIAWRRRRGGRYARGSSQRAALRPTTGGRRRRTIRACPPRRPWPGSRRWSERSALSSTASGRRSHRPRRASPGTIRAVPDWAGRLAAATGWSGSSARAAWRPSIAHTTTG